MKASIRQRLEDRWALSASAQPERPVVSLSSIEDTFHEKHYCFDELAEKWRLSHEMIRRLFGKEAGVVHFGGVYRVPESVARRVYSRLTIL